MIKNMRLTLILAYFHMRSRYRKTWAGFIWVIASPIITFIVQAFIFKGILKINIKDYPFFLLTGLMPWFFISQCFNSSTSCLVNSRDLLLGVRVHPSLIVGTQVLDQFFNFLFAFAITLAIIIFNSSLNIDFAIIFLLLPSVLILYLFVYYSVLLLSFWHVFYRDIQYIVQFVMNLAFFITPIFYSSSFVMKKYQWIVIINPFVPFIKIFQDLLYSFDFNNWLLNFTESLGIVALIFLLLFISYKKRLRDFYINI